MRAALAASVVLVLSIEWSSAGAAAEICYSDPTDALATCQSESGCVLPTNDTVFHCPTEGDATVPQLAQRGWWIVSVGSKPAALVSGANMAVEQLVIRWPDGIFRSGFE